MENVRKQLAGIAVLGFLVLVTMLAATLILSWANARDQKAILAALSCEKKVKTIVWWNAGSSVEVTDSGAFKSDSALVDYCKQQELYYRHEMDSTATEFMPEAYPDSVTIDKVLDCTYGYTLERWAKILPAKYAAEPDCGCSNN